MRIFDELRQPESPRIAQSKGSATASPNICVHDAVRSVGKSGSSAKVPTPPCHVRTGSELATLAAIVGSEVTLAIWDRPPPIQVGSFTDIASTHFVTQASRAHITMAEHLALSPRQQWHAALVDDVAKLAILYAEIMGIERIEVRLERIAGNACWRFHADYVAVRLITTYAGQGTQWLDQKAAAMRAKHATTKPHQLATGAVGLFKGRKLAGDAAIVHRSPPIDGTGEQRLLLVIDCERTDPYG